MAALVAGMPTAADAFGRGDRKRLTAEFSRGFNILKNDFKVAQFQFHVPPATSFLRLHQIEKYGDDLSSFRHTVLYVNEKKTGARGIEVGRGGLGLRGIVPVFSQGRHVGSVEFGGDLAPAIDEAKNVFNVEAGVLLSSEATTQVWSEWQQNVKPIGNHILFYSTRPQLTQALITPRILAQAKAAAGGIYTASGTHAGRDYYIAMAPLKDYSGREIGYLSVFKDQTELLNKINRVLIINIAIYLSILFVISGAINFSLKRTVINPVIELTKAADEVSMGKLSEKIEVKTNDEIETLAKSIDRMRVSMKKLLE
jgi:methyl-accepting chemotaxis protein